MERDPEQVETRLLHEYSDLAGKVVLEVGCGEGRLTWRYAADAGRAVGLDADVDRLAVAARDLPPSLPGRVLLAAGAAEALPFGEATFERIILSWSL